MANQDHRVEKLEAAIYAGLTPAHRVCEVLKAVAEGNLGLSDRIVETCPRETWRICDPAFTDHLDDVYIVCEAAAAIFDNYAFACRQIERHKDFLATEVMGAIVSFTSAWVVAAMLKDKEVETVDWKSVDEAEEKARTDASVTLARMLDGWQTGLHERVRAEWAGFDAFCRSQLHLDARTLLKGCEMPEEITAWVESILSEPPPERHPAGTDKNLAEVAAEIEASWRTAFLARQGKNEAVPVT